MRGAWAILLLGLWGCGSSNWGDRLPPRLLETEVSEDGKEVELRFDEPIASAWAAVDGAPASLVETKGSSVPVALPAGLAPGSGHVWEAEVSDQSRNTSSVAGKFYAPNETPATLRLNEVRVAGSGHRSDFVELRVEAEGNLGGWSLEAWMSAKARQRLVLPEALVAKGDLVVVRFRPHGEPTDSAPRTREYWPAEPKGLSPSKGIIVLRPAPDAPAVEALLYSKKPGEATAFAAAAGWTSGDELDPSRCTPTRTWSRSEEGQWFITATGGATPGAPNVLTPWEGLPSSRGGSTTTKERRKGHPQETPKRGRRSRRDSRPIRGKEAAV